MDALRKAERDKRKAADSGPEEPAEAEDVTELAAPAAAPEEESTEPIQLPPEHESTAPLPRMPDMEATEPLPRPRSGDISFELEPLPGAAQNVPPEEEQEGPDEFDWADIDDETARRFRAMERKGEDGERQTEPGGGRPAGPYDQESTLPSERAIKSSLKDYFEASRSMERPSMRLVGTEPEPEIETGVRESTHVDAQTVFAAGESAGPPRFLRWAVAAVLLLAVTLGAVGFWYYYLTPTPRGAFSPRVVQSVPTSPPEPPAAIPAPATPPSTAPALAQQTTPGAPEPQATPEPPRPVHPAPAEAKGGEASAAAAVNAAVAPEKAAATRSAPPGQAEPAPAVEKATKAPPPKPPGKRVATAPKTARSAPAKAVAAPAARAAASPTQAPPGERSTLPAEIEVPPSAIQITHSKPAVSVNQVLTEAYKSFKAGELDRAGRLYRSALVRHSDQRDALLGLAAVAIQRGQSAKAYEFYQRVLRLNPQDPVATAALATLSGGASPGRTEARLKMLLGQDPSDSYLHFALGSLHARRDHWSAAQQEYFDAYRLDDGNADYAYNLAVSLDRLGSGEAALTYYRKALELAGRQPSRFSTTEVMSRIKALSAVANTQ